MYFRIHFGSMYKEVLLTKVQLQKASLSILRPNDEVGLAARGGSVHINPANAPRPAKLYPSKYRHVSFRPLVRRRVAKPFTIGLAKDCERASEPIQLRLGYWGQSMTRKQIFSWFIGRARRQRQLACWRFQLHISMVQTRTNLLTRHSPNRRHAMPSTIDADTPRCINPRPSACCRVLAQGKTAHQRGFTH